MLMQYDEKNNTYYKEHFMLMFFTDFSELFTILFFCDKIKILENLC